ncbi:DUF2726 domain-containing protein [Deinococcus sp. Marseille-Q6407]|uniref:DUF2726 domain-containing protein n=1 Tax=Deinococcus sp. Marseille-Q6407 TaxID=2969223 RepID=UPI0021C24E7D|nr:DUF2726 domain-containing protein [Deinococcus sp. Marseille-Q6407]
MTAITRVKTPALPSGHVEQSSGYRSATGQYQRLDLYQRHMLCALARAGGEMSTSSLATDMDLIRSRMSQLSGAGMVIQVPGGWKLTSAARPIAQADARASMHVSLIVAQPNMLLQPCESYHERMIYKVCIQLFTGCPVILNVPLHRVINADTISRFLNEEDMRFATHPSAHFDVVVLGATSLRPILAIEADGDQHNHPDQVAQDTKKNRICHVVGLPLVRVRIRTQINEEKVVRQPGSQLTRLARAARPEHRGHEELASALTGLRR